MGFLCGSAGKESVCNAGDLGSIPGLGRSTGEGKGYPLQYSGLENPMDCIVHGVSKSQTWLSNFHFHFTLCKRKIAVHLDKYLGVGLVGRVVKGRYNFLRNCQSVFPSCFAILHSHMRMAIWESVRLLHILASIRYCQGFLCFCFSHFSRCVVASHRFYL